MGQAPHAGDSFRGRDPAGGDGGAGTDLRWEQSIDAVSCGCLLAGGGTECPEEAEGTGAARGHGRGHSLISADQTQEDRAASTAQLLTGWLPSSPRSCSPPSSAAQPPTPPFILPTPNGFRRATEAQRCYRRSFSSRLASQTPLGSSTRPGPAALGGAGLCQLEAARSPVLSTPPVSTWETEDYFTTLTFFNLQQAPRAAAALQTTLQYFVFPIRPSEGTHSQEQPPGPP